MILERPVLPPAGPIAVVRDLSVQNVVNAVVAFIFAASGPVAIILTVGTGAGLSEAELASWLFGSFFLNGLISIGACLIYRQPLVFFWTIPGTVLVGPALDHLSFPEVIGAFYATGLLMLGLGLSGWVRRAMQAVPMPIVMAMVAGVFVQFGLDLVNAVAIGPWIAGPMVVVFVVASVSGRIGRLVPPLIAALVVGGIAVLALGAAEPLSGEPLGILARPLVQTPVFTVQALIELVVPLAITVLVVQNGQGFAVLTAAGHKPPINAIATICGAGSILTAVTGTVSTCLTGPVNAILAQGRVFETRYAAGVTVGVFGLGFGLLAPFFTRLMLAMPGPFIATLAGLAMLRVLQSAFGQAFGGRFTLGALVTFLVTLSDISIVNIGAPFWGLILGYTASRLLEREDFAADAGARRVG